jgi:hypothetical protein
MSSRPDDSLRVRALHPLQWLWEPLESDPTFLLRSMFGAKAVYLSGKLVLCLCHREEPWRGLLVCTERTSHASLLAEFPALAPHPILPKWLYLSTSSHVFDRVATRLVQCAGQRDPRLGIIPPARKKKSRSPVDRLK